MKKNKLPYDANETMIAFVGENCPNKEEEKYTQKYLDSLYEAKADWETILELDEDALAYARTPAQKQSAKKNIKANRKHIGQLKDEIILCKKMMKKEIDSQEVLAIA